MTALQVLEKLNSKNITLSVDGGFLRYKAPKGTMTDKTIRLLREHKARLIEALRTKQTMPAITVQKMDVCLHGKPCSFLSFANDRPVCARKSKQPIFDMDGCPNGRWEHGQDKQNPQKKTMTCYSCGGQMFWRKKDNTGGRWICKVCHPPVLSKDEIEWLQ